MLTFTELVGDAADFAQFYRDQRPLLRKGAVREPERLLSFSDLDMLLMSEAIRPPYVRVTKQGAEVREGIYTRLVRVQLDHMNDVPDPSKLIEAFQTGATLTWNSMNHFWPPLRELTTMLSGELGCRTDVVAFATPAGVRGFAPHLDSTEVFVVQTSGTKKWTVWPTWRPRPAAGQAIDANSLGEPLFEVDLEPGDVMYLPWGTPHVAFSGSQVSLHLSITAKPQTWADLITETVRTAIADDEHFAGFPVLSPQLSQTTAVELRRLLDVALKKAENIDEKEQAARLIDVARPDYGTGNTDFFQRLEALGTALPGHTLIGRPKAEVKAELRPGEHDDQVQVLIGPRTYAMPAGYLPALRALNDNTAVSIEELDTLLGDLELAQKFARMLVQVGFLEVKTELTGQT